MLYVFISKNMYKRTINKLLLVSNILLSWHKSSHNGDKYALIALL